MWYGIFVVWFVHFAMWFRLYVLLTSLPVQSSSTQEQVKPVLRGAPVPASVLSKITKLTHEPS